MGGITLTTDDYSARQLCALVATALIAPIVTFCADVSWQWVLLALGAAGLYYIYVLWAVGPIAPHVGYGRMLFLCFGRVGARMLLTLYWLWLLLSLGLAARLSAAAFPQDHGVPLIPLVLVALAALVAAKDSGAVCRFGSVLLLFVAALVAFNLAFAAADVEPKNLLPAGNPGDGSAPLAVFLLPTASLFLRDRMDSRNTSYTRWYALMAVLALAVSLICVGALGLPLAQKSRHAFWLVSRSISVLGVMERFEAAISALLSISFCCLLAYFLTLSVKTAQSVVPLIGNQVAAWTNALLGFGAIWLAPLLPRWVWLAGSGLFWVLLPAITLGVVRGKKFVK